MRGKLKRYWPLLVAAFAIVPSTVYLIFVLRNSPIGDKTVIYWLSWSIPGVPKLLGIILIPSTILLFSIALLKSKRLAASTSPVIVGISASLLSWANVAACGAALPYALQSNRAFESQSFENHIYRLDGSWKIGIGRNSRALFAVWECDQLGWLCRIIHREERRISDQEFEEMNAALQIDKQSSSLQLFLEGELVYSHTIPFS